MTPNNTKVTNAIKELVGKSNQYLNIEQNKDKTIAYLYIILSLVSLSFFGLFAIGPTLTTITELNTEYKENKAVLEKIQEKNRNLASLKIKHSELENDLPLITSAIPDTPLISQLTRQLETLSSSNNLSIENLETGLLELYPAKNVNTPIFSYSFTIAVNGSQVDIYNFIQEVANLERIIGIERLTTGENAGEFSANISGKSFFYKNE